MAKDVLQRAQLSELCARFYELAPAMDPNQEQRGQISQRAERLGKTAQERERQGGAASEAGRPERDFGKAATGVLTGAGGSKNRKQQTTRRILFGGGFFLIAVCIQTVAFCMVSVAISMESR